MIAKKADFSLSYRMYICICDVVKRKSTTYSWVLYFFFSYKYISYNRIVKAAFAAAAVAVGVGVSFIFLL